MYGLSLTAWETYWWFKEHILYNGIIPVLLPCLLSANANMNFFGQNIFTIMNIQIIVFSHLNIQTIALLSLPGFTDGLFDRTDILSAIWGLYHYHPLSPASVSMCYRGWSFWWIWITRCVGNGALDRAGINNDSQFTQFTLNIC